MSHNIVLIHNNEIVNCYEIEGHQTQLIWNNILTFNVKELNNCFNYELDNPKIQHNINMFKAVYYDGVQLVKNGKLICTPFWKFWK